MMKYSLITLICIAMPPASFADTLVAARNLRAQSIITFEDVVMREGDTPGALIAPEEAMGLEARVTLYAGRPIMAGDVGPAAIIERNQIIKLIYKTGGLSISADARALGRGGPGDFVRVMNLTSKSTVSGIVAPDGSVHVGEIPGT